MTTEDTTPARTCAVCRKPCKNDDWDDWCFSCQECKVRYPPVLRKACGDNWLYALKLTTGEILRFCQARIEGQWITLLGVRDLPDDMFCSSQVTLRLNKIVWLINHKA